ncbi:MAG: LEA type 2 family protein [Pseudomonadota bacterium]
MQQPCRRRFNLVLLALWCGGCSSIDDAVRASRSPTFRLVDLELSERDARTAEADLRVAISNPNAWQIAIDTIDYDVVINGTRLGTAVGGRDVFIGAGNEREVRLRLAYPNDDRLRSLLERTPPRGVGYRITGTAKVVGVGVDRVPFALEGTWHTS